MSVHAATKGGSSSSSVTIFNHQEIIKVITGLLVVMFVAMLSSTIVTTALPSIMGDLHGSTTAAAWVVTMNLLVMTVSSPIWSKLSDLYNKKALVLIATSIFILGTSIAGVSQNIPMLLTARGIQGLGLGGIVAATLSVMAAIISPRDRGRYSGYISAVMALGTVIGPLLGGLVVDISSWHYCFYISVPFALLGMFLLAKNLQVPEMGRKVSIDWVGTMALATAASCILVWVSLASHSFAWISTSSIVLLGVAIVASIVALMISFRHPDPIIPPRLVADKTIALASIASISVGIAYFGIPQFLSNYFQVTRGYTPTHSGLLLLPLVIGSVVGAVLSGRLITATGKWKTILVVAAVSQAIGLGLLMFISEAIPLWQLGLFMMVHGLGNGALIQNLVMVAQNRVGVNDLGTTGGLVTFVRSLGGTLGFTVLSIILGISHHVGEIFGLAAALCLITIVALLVMPNSELRTTVEKTD